MHNLDFSKGKSVSLFCLRAVTRVLYPLRGTGLPRVAEFIRRRVALRNLSNSGETGIWIDDFCGKLRFRCNLSEHMGSQIFFRGAYSGDQLMVLKRLLSGGAVFVDVGANQGEFTVCAAAHIPEGMVYAFEPVSAIRKRLKANVEANGFDNVQIQGVGLSDEPRDDVPIFDSSEKFSDGTENVGLPTVYGNDQRALELEAVSLRCLDDCLPLKNKRVDLIKIDVEGSELFVLRGAEETINVCRPYILFEANEETSRAAGYTVSDIIEWLIKRGYRLELVGRGGELRPVDELGAFGNILASP